MLSAVHEHVKRAIGPRRRDFRAAQQHRPTIRPCRRPALRNLSGGSPVPPIKRQFTACFRLFPLISAWL